MIRILFVGDLVASTGCALLRDHLEALVDRERVDFVIVNAENAAQGRGITPKVMAELDHLPVDVWTTGNHVWDKKEGVALLDAHPFLLRPANYPAGNPGRGWCVEETAAGVPVAVLNLQGQALMAPVDNPFAAADRCLQEIAATAARIVVVDLHAETTSEKQAMGWHLDGRVSAVLGTHTHVPTADERVLPAGTAYISDVGMTGAIDSVIGMKIEGALHRFRTNTPCPLEPARRNPRLSAVLVEADEATGRAASIRRISLGEA